MEGALNGFEKHDIQHVSPSNVNMAREALDAWLARYLYKIKFPFGWAALQGSSVELGVAHGLFQPDAPVDECIGLAMDHMRNSSKMMKNQLDELEAREGTVTQMVTVTLEQLRPLGVPEEAPRGEKNQHEIRIPVQFREGEAVDAIGYLDFWYPKLGPNGTVIDLKTTAKAPTSWSLAHGIQASIYQKAMHRKTGKEPEVKFFYALKRKKDPYVWLDLEDSSFYLAHFKRTVRNLERLLNAHTREELIDMIPHNPDSFYWNDADHIRAELYPE